MDHRISLSRRDFLKSGTVATTAISLSARSYGRVHGANERIAVGLIGCGSRGLGAHLPGIAAHAKQQNVEIRAVCDPWRIRREMAAAKAREVFGVDARACVSYRELLDDEIDAVMIASCDHQHTTHLEASARAGKDVYCEKPLGMDLSCVIRACDAVRANKVIFQAGTQLRSLSSMTGARELFKTGVLGPVSRIEQCRNASRPYWYSYLRDAKSEDVDWSEFLMNAAHRPFRADLFTGWYGYRDFSDGPVPGLGSHFIDLVHYITGAQFPSSAVAHGGTFSWKDEHRFTCPDHAQAAWVYPEGFMVSYSTNFGNSSGNVFAIYGAEGTMDLVNWNAPTISKAGAVRPTGLGENRPVPHVEAPDHFLNWLQCLRSRKEPNASIDAGYQHAVAVIMAMKAFDSGRRQTYDPDRREIREG